MKKLILSDKQFGKLYDHTLNEMIAYHGTKSEFEKFSTKFMGSGEGSQVYGWGIYVTQSPKTAKFYCQASFNTREVQVFGKPRKEYSNEELKRLGDGYVSLKFLYDRTMEKTLAAVRKIMIWIHEDKEGIEMWSERADTLDEEELEKLKWAQEKLFHAETLKEWIKNEDFRESLVRGCAVIYTVDIPNDNGNNYLQWDMAYDESFVRNLMSLLPENKMKVALYNMIMDGGKLTGERIYGCIKKSLTGSWWDDEGADKEASLALSKCGFDGIKVPIGFMHETDEKGFNYIIFDENNIKIIKSEKINF